MHKTFTHHLRVTRPAYGTKDHFDWAASGDSLRELEPVLPPAEHIQTNPLTVLRSIDRADFIWTAVIFATAFVGIGVFFAMGAK